MTTPESAATTAATTRTRHARLAALRRHRAADDPAIAAADRELREDVLAEHIRRLVDTFPPLTPAQRDRLAALLRPAVDRQDGQAAR